MSYARFGWDGSDVYVFLSVGNYLDCCACRLSPVTEDYPFGRGFKAYDTESMITHLHEHRAAGHHVPDDTLAELLEDAADNDAAIRDGKVGQ